MTIFVVERRPLRRSSCAFEVFDQLVVGWIASRGVAWASDSSCVIVYLRRNAGERTAFFQLSGFSTMKSRMRRCVRQVRDVISRRQ